MNHDLVTYIAKSCLKKESCEIFSSNRKEAYILKRYPEKTEIMVSSELSAETKSKIISHVALQLGTRLRVCIGDYKIDIDKKESRKKKEVSDKLLPYIGETCIFEIYNM